MNKTIIQVPIETKIRDQALRAATDLGFSSLQESIRLFLHQLIDKKIDLTWKEPDVKLSAKNEKRYMKAMDDYYQGRVKTKTFNNAKKLTKYLNSL